MEIKNAVGGSRVYIVGILISELEALPRNISTERREVL
jgi:hypothetical protein